MKGFPWIVIVLVGFLLTMFLLRAHFPWPAIRMPSRQSGSPPDAGGTTGGAAPTTADGFLARMMNTGNARSGAHAGAPSASPDPVSRVASLGATPTSSSSSAAARPLNTKDDGVAGSIPRDRRFMKITKKHGVRLKELQGVELEADRSPIPDLGDFLERPQSVLALMSAFVVAGSALIWLENLVTKGLVPRKSPH